MNTEFARDPHSDALEHQVRAERFNQALISAGFTIHTKERFFTREEYDYWWDRWGGKYPTRLEDCYKQASSYKHEALRYWRSVCAEMGGERFCITAHNCMCFTVCFVAVDPSNGRLMFFKATGKGQHAYYID